MSDAGDGRTVAIASKDVLFAEAAAAYVRARGWSVVGTASDAVEVLRVVSHQRPAGVLIVGEPERMSADALSEQIRRRWTSVRVVVVDDRSDHAVTGAEVVSALESTQQLPNDDTGQRLVTERQALRRLSRRELRVLRLLASGASLPAIAETMSITENTARTHVRNVYTKLGLHARVEAMSFGARHGLISGNGGG